MKIRSGLLLKEIAGTHVVVPIGQNVVELSFMLKLNNTGALLWKHLSEDASEGELIDLLVNTYGIDRKTSIQDVNEFVELLKVHNLMETTS